MRVVLRCDASTGAGVGHLVRSLALAEAAAARGWSATLAGHFDAALAQRLVRAAGVAVTHAPPDEAGLVALARDASADVLHIDHYALGHETQGLRTQTLLSSIEDGLFGRRPADVVIDSTFGAELTGRPDDGSGLVLLGVAFAPLRASVRRARLSLTRSPRPDDGRDVLVVMGGTDAFGVSGAAAGLAVAAGAGRVSVIASREAGARVAVDAPSAVVLGPQDDLPALAAGADVVVGAAGTSVWEMACIGVAQAIVAVTENQRVGYERAVAGGLAVGLGTASDLRGGAAPLAALHELLDDAGRRRRLGERGRAIVDGRGADRVLDAWWVQSTGRPAFIARPARGEDAALLLEWRNDPATRAASRSTGAVQLEDHLDWLYRVLADAARTLFVVEHVGEPVGTVRFDRSSAGMWEVSVTLAPQARGRGLAEHVLACAEEAWRRGSPRSAALLAFVRPENTASERLFAAAGYVRRPEYDEPAVDAWVKSGC